jgi:hypothetical protein
MRIIDLIEAPINQYSAIGDWNDERGSMISSNGRNFDGSARDTSHKIVKSEKAVQKIKSAWARVPQKFNFLC